MTGTITVGAVGLGAHGLRQLEHLMASPDRWRVAAVADASPVAYARFQAAHHEKRIPVFRDAGRLAGAGLDVLLVSTTAPGHVTVAHRLLDRDYKGALLIEKPIAPTVVEALGLRRRIDADGWPGRVAVDFHRRCSRMYAEVVEVLRSGALGDVHRISYVTPGAAKMSMKGSHYLDLAGWLVGAEPVEVSAVLAGASTIDRRGAYFFDPSGVIDVGYAQGARLTLDLSGSRGPKAAGMEVHCERGRVVVPLDESTATIEGPDGTRTVPSDATNAIYGWFEATLTALVDGASPLAPCTLDEAITNLQLLVAAELSNSRAGAPVGLPLPGEALERVLRVA